MAGVVLPGTYSPNAPYWKDGQWGTREQHEQRARVDEQNRQRAETARNVTNTYATGQPSVGAANTAAANIQNRNLNMSVGPDGRVNLSNESELAARQQAEEDARRQRDRAELLRLIQQSTGQTAATITHPGVGGGEAGRNAAFSRAKDRAGQIARASLSAIAEEMAGRGISGSGIESLREAGAMDQTAGALLEVDRDQAMADAARAEEVNDLNFQGGITQRGQDLANRESYLALLRSIYSY